MANNHTHPSSTDMNLSSGSTFQGNHAPPMPPSEQYNNYRAAVDKYMEDKSDAMYLRLLAGPANSHEDQSNSNASPSGLSSSQAGSSPPRGDGQPQ